ncbi:MAG: transporter substrate-binding domain-containing protein [Oscillospiraceae bacterium]|nr:transporter substrate-binding domain-containing protein [Oscillospiraceae bacterium]
MKKRIICLLLAAAALFSLASCGGGRYKTVKTVSDREYSIAFRNGDVTYHYIDGALRELSSDGTIDVLAQQWLGGKAAVSFPGGKNALDKLGYIEPRVFTIGVDLSSFPLCQKSGNDYTGFDVELARAVCSKLGWQLQVQPIVSRDAYVELNSGNIDCAWGGCVLDPESSSYTVLVTYMSDKLVVAAAGGGKSVLNGGSMYMGTDQMYLDILEENPRIADKLEQITRVSGTPTELFACLDRGECDFIITTASAVRYYGGA